MSQRLSGSVLTWPAVVPLLLLLPKPDCKESHRCTKPAALALTQTHILVRIISCCHLDCREVSQRIDFILNVASSGARKRPLSQ